MPEAIRTDGLKIMGATQGHVARLHPWVPGQCRSILADASLFAAMVQQGGRHAPQPLAGQGI